MIDVVIPYHAARERNGMLARAVASVQAQSAHHRLILQRDDTGAGAAATRNAGLARAETAWVALLDSDDELTDPDHLAKLQTAAYWSGADLVYPWFRRSGWPDPWPERENREFDEAALRRGNFIAMTVLIRRQALLDVGGFQPDLTVSPPAQCEEWGTWLRLLDAGARFAHLPERTWTWHVHGGNTAGSPLVGDARSGPRGRRPGSGPGLRPEHPPGL